eukprot:TRINITY_DN8231_c2_g1_i1.p1 TRINITY_DN8231_c2_g1~~TRINITY_DN8231_c2_g1_i1.p1  ORF type:complete len:403 (+),score=169.98 TRINITY_DN8231_c2_g1_i1:56-1210(+)
MPGSYAAAAVRAVPVGVDEGRLRSMNALVARQVAAEREDERRRMRDNARRRRRLQRAAEAAEEAAQEQRLRALAQRAATRHRPRRLGPVPQPRPQPPPRPEPELEPEPAEAVLSVRALIAALAADDDAAVRLSGSVRSMNRLLRRSLHSDGGSPLSKSTADFMDAEAKAAAGEWAQQLLAHPTALRAAAAAETYLTAPAAADAVSDSASTAPSSVFVPQPSAESPKMGARILRRRAQQKAVQFQLPRQTPPCSPPLRPESPPPAPAPLPPTASMDEAALERSIKRLDGLLSARRAAAAAAPAAARWQPEEHTAAATPAVAAPLECGGGPPDGAAPCEGDAPPARPQYSATPAAAPVRRRRAPTLCGIRDRRPAVALHRQRVQVP